MTAIQPCAGHTTLPVKVLRSLSGTSLVTPGNASPVIMQGTSSLSFTPPGAGDAAAGPMLWQRAGSATGPTTVSVVTKAVTPKSMVQAGSAGTVLAAGLGDAAPGSRLVKATVGTPVAAGSSKARIAAPTVAGSSSARLAVASQLRAVSLEYSHTELSAATRSWSSSHKVGSGKHGAVYKGEMKDGSEVAVKAIDLAAVVGAGDAPEDAGFDEEVIMLSKFRHPNLVTLLGWGSHGSMRYLVYELLSGGDLFRRLHKSRSTRDSQPFPWHARLSVCLDAATGLSHMHNSTPKAFHRDIKSANILLDKHGTAKMADFGLSCSSSHAGADHVDVRYASGTPGYRCPLYERSGRVSEATEAYSFSMVLLEVLLGMDPSAANPKVPGGLIFPIQDAVSPSKPGAAARCMQNLDKTAGNWPLEAIKEIVQLALRAADVKDEKRRPAFVEFVRLLRSVVERFPASSQESAASKQERPQASSPVPVAKQEQASSHAPEARQEQARQLPEPQLPQFQPSGQLDEQEEARSAPARGWQGRATAASAAGSGAATRASSAVRSIVAMSASPSNLAQQPISPTAKGQSQETSPVHVSSQEYMLELILVTGGGIANLTEEQRQLILKPVRTGEGGTLIAAVGRGQQPELFESWLSDTRIRTCISRNAFEVSWRRGSSDGPWIIAMGSGPVSVDGNVVPVNVPFILKHGSEIGLLYGKQLLIRFRFHDPTSKASQVRSYTGTQVSAGTSMVIATRPSMPVAPSSPSRARASVQATGPDGGSAIGFGNLSAQGSFTPRSMELSSSGHRPRIIEQTSISSGYGRPLAAASGLGREVGTVPGTTICPCPVAGSRSLSLQPAPATRWRLACVRAEGLPEDRLAALPTITSHLVLPESGGELLVGRDHQPRLLQAWLPDPVIRLCVTRTHLRIRTSEGGVVVTNLSPTMLCVDEKVMKQHDERLMLPGQVLSLMRKENNSGELLPYLALKLLPSGTSEAVLPTPSPPAPRSLLSSTSEEEAHDLGSLLAGVVQPAVGAKTFGGLQAVQPQAFSEAPPVVSLEISGARLKGEPLGRRIVGPVSLAGKPLLVGSRHQPEMLATDTQGWANIIDRDHFCIASEGGVFWLLCLTSKGLWRVHEGEEPVILILDDLAQLSHGDIVVPRLGEATVEQCSRQLCWHFNVISK
eukprot:TRINITY_DN5152_c0_g1_i1.p1 TRINITY_DN5152_c0_g1~~TRINITY_DN5152_c0_g1_i1.p1  ORF type:complete len:1182 (+),score=199.44 TRINITY_DN5152_c0_g1_i1:49-3546(+)